MFGSYGGCNQCLPILGDFIKFIYNLDLLLQTHSAMSARGGAGGLRHLLVLVNF